MAPSIRWIRAIVTRLRGGGTRLRAVCSTPVAGPGTGPPSSATAAATVARSGLDISIEFVESARSRFPDLCFAQASFRALPFSDGAVGGILAWYSLIHTDPADVPAVLAEFARVLVPGGSLLLGFFVGEPREPFSHAVTTAYFWSAEALDALLADAGFEVTFAELREREPGEMSVRPHGALIARRVPWAG